MGTELRVTQVDHIGDQLLIYLSDETFIVLHVLDLLALDLPRHPAQDDHEPRTLFEVRR